jgi:subtilisin family serine protease
VNTGLPSVSHLLGAVGLGMVLALSLAQAGFAVEPEAFIVTGDGEVVTQVFDAQDAGDALELAFAGRSGERLRIEMVYGSHAGVVYPVNDPLAAIQWNLDVVGVADAWRTVDGGGTVVAILDSPINFTGPDGLCAPIVHPYNALTRTPGLADLNVVSGFGHGTHIAGTVVQCTNNGIGVAGFAPGATLMPVQVLDQTGSGLSSDLVAGIDWAVAHGADVINLSLGKECSGPYGPGCSDYLVDLAIDRAIRAGVILVGSSGNQASANLAYPAAHPDVFSVGATDDGDRVWYEGPVVGSNAGATLDLVAPGVDIVQETTAFGEYSYGSGAGTSMAAPHVTATIALMLDADPSLSRVDVLHILRERAADLGVPGHDPLHGHGRLDIGASVTAATPPCPATPICDSVVEVDSGARWSLWRELVGTPSVSSFFFGNPGDVPFMGDWDGDGVETPGMYRQSDGYVYLRNSNTQGIADVRFFFGNPGDVPIAGDFNGDGFDTVSIYRPSSQEFFIINELGANEGGLGAAEFSYVFGDPGDKPFVGDFDGDGIQTVGLHRESTGLVYFRNSHAQGNADAQFIFGDPGDRIVAGDWNGDGRDTVAVFRPSTGRLHVNLENAPGAADWSRFVGSPAFIVTAGRS